MDFIWLSKSILLLICMVLQFTGRTSFCTLSLENSTDSYLFFWLALIRSVSYFFFLYESPSSASCLFFYSISSNIHETLSINPSANVFLFRDFNVHHKGWLSYSGGTDRPGEIWRDLLRWSTFLLGSLTLALTILHSWIYFYLLMLVSVLQWLFIHWKIQIMLLSQFPLTFCQTQDMMPRSSYSLILFSCWLEQSLWSFERCSMRRYLQAWYFCCC